MAPPPEIEKAPVGEMKKKQKHSDVTVQEPDTASTIHLTQDLGSGSALSHDEQCQPRISPRPQRVCRMVEQHFLEKMQHNSTPAAYKDEPDSDDCDGVDEDWLVNVHGRQSEAH